MSHHVHPLNTGVLSVWTGEVMPYHVRVTPRSDRSRVEVKLDLAPDQLEERFLGPYREGRPLLVGGRVIPPEDLERIEITYTSQTSQQLIPRIRAARDESSGVELMSDEWYVAASGKDVTDDFILGPPRALVAELPLNEPTTRRDPRIVFVVHGRNRAARDSLFTFLWAIGLHPLEWSEAVLTTGKSLPYVGDILDAAFSAAQAIVVLMTPDDEARLRESLREPGEPPYEIELTGQARANVIFEAGMALGRNPDRTVLIELGNVRPFSDVAGRHIIRLNNTTQRRQELAQRLQVAGCPVNLSGTAWHSAGVFVVDT